MTTEPVVKSLHDLQADASKLWDVLASARHYGHALIDSLSIPDGERETQKESTTLGVLLDEAMRIPASQEAGLAHLDSDEEV